MADLTSADAPVVATITRDGRVESVHRGIGVVVDASGTVIHQVGDASALVYPRSTLKPVQTLAVLETGISFTPLEMVLATASHQGTARHRAAIAGFLLDHQLGQGLLQCPADWPLDEKAKEEMLVAGETSPTAIAMNCSGKHAGFLACCQHMGWSLDDYLDNGHPLQMAIRQRVEELAGEQISHTTPDGCGAPLHRISLIGLARAIAGVSRGDSAHSQALLAALVEHPWAIAGPGHANTVVIEALGGVAKIGAEGLVVIGLPGGLTTAVKILDGSMRATTPVALSLLRAVGAGESAVIDALIAETSATIYGGGSVTGGLNVVI